MLSKISDTVTQERIRSRKRYLKFYYSGDPIFKIDEERGSVSYVSTEKRTGCFPLTIIARNPEELYANEEWDKRVSFTDVDGVVRWRPGPMYHMDKLNYRYL